MRTRQTFSMGGSILLSLLLITIVFTPYLTAAAEMNLLQATKDGETEIVKALIESGADVKAKNKYGETALIVAAAWGHSEIVQIFLRAGADVNAQGEDGDTAMLKAITEGHTEIVKMLREAGSPEVTLIQAARHGLLETVKALIESGADVKAKDDEHSVTALMWAAMEGHAEIVHVLLQAGRM